MASLSHSHTHTHTLSLYLSLFLFVWSLVRIIFSTVLIRSNFCKSFFWLKKMFLCRNHWVRVNQRISFPPNVFCFPPPPPTPHLLALREMYNWGGGGGSGKSLPFGGKHICWFTWTLNHWHKRTDRLLIGTSRLPCFHWAFMLLDNN